VPGNQKSSSPYDGDELNLCLAKVLDFGNTFAIVVSGDSWNPCGHLILKVGAVDSYYFHIAGAYARPKVMRELGFKSYLRENRKRILSERPVKIPKPYAAQVKLEELMSKRWLWLMASNNCASFLEDIVQAGGSDAGLWLNCPTLERFS